MFKYTLLLACIMSVESIAQAIEIENRTGTQVIVFFNNNIVLSKLVNNGDSCADEHYTTASILVNGYSYFVGSAHDHYAVVVRKNNAQDVVLVYKPMNKRQSVSAS